jgi:hypothetical protein
MHLFLVQDQDIQAGMALSSGPRPSTTFIPKPYFGKNVVAAVRTFENMS